MGVSLDGQHRTGHPGPHCRAEEHALACADVRLEELEKQAEARLRDRREFASALRRDGVSIIAEIKKASPSKGLLSASFNPPAIAAEYEGGGAAALSVLTDEQFFQGSTEDLEAARASVSIPVLRKDFTIAPYHVVEAAAAGADAILLIAAILTERQMRDYRELAARYAMAALVEVHSVDELASALDSGGEIIGVNNRNLHTFEVTLETSLRLAEEIPSNLIRVSESGIHSAADIHRLRRAGYDAFLVGEHLMKSGSPRPCAAGSARMMVKICGITNSADAQSAVDAGADALGFNFFPGSPRYITPETAASIEAPGLRVGVFVDESPQNVAAIARQVRLDIVQFTAVRIRETSAAASVESVSGTQGLDASGHNGSRSSGARRTRSRDGPKLRLVNPRRDTSAVHSGRRPRSRECGRRDPAGTAMGRGRLLASRASSRPQRSRKSAAVHLRRSHGFLMIVSQPDAKGHFGPYGGRYVPEVLMAPLEELEQAYRDARIDPAFDSELKDLLTNYAGRPTPLYYARRLSESLGGAKIYLKREDLLHTGAHKINNALGQALLARRMGRQRIIAETGAGQHGVATATACALFGLKCVVYMGEEDMRRQRLNVFRMRLLGATVVGVTSRQPDTERRHQRSHARLGDERLGYVLSPWIRAGPHPYPLMVRDFHRVIGEEARAQILEAEGRLPDSVFACVGGGSNAIGIFHPFIPDDGVRLVGVEAGGRSISLGEHAARFAGGVPGVLHGCSATCCRTKTDRCH